MTRAAWGRWPIIEAPVRSRYLPTARRVSHFRPCVDTLRSIALHGGLIGRILRRRLRRSASADATDGVVTTNHPEGACDVSCHSAEARSVR